MTLEPIVIALAIIGALLVTAFCFYLWFPEINKGFGSRCEARAVVKNKSLEAQDYSFAPTEADIPRYGNDLIYRVFVQIGNETHETLVGPRQYQSIHVGDTVKVWLYRGQFFGTKYVDLCL
jgi:hypothetical protein